jgi:hypothetical protein
MKLDLMKVGINLTAISLVGLVVGPLLIIVMSCINLMKWVFRKIFG